MLYLYTTGGASAITRIVDDDGRELQAGSDYEERDASVLRACTSCGEQTDPGTRTQAQRERDNRDDELRCSDCHDELEA